MRIRVCVRQLHKAMQEVARMVPARPSSPPLVNVRLEGRSGALALDTFNGNDWLRLELEAVVEREGIFLVPVRLCQALLARFGDEWATLEWDGSQLHVHGNTGRYRIPGMDAGTFPELPLVGQTVQVPARTLWQGLQRVVAAAADDPSKAVLCSVRLEADENLLNFVAIDGHRLAVFAAEEGIGMPCACTLPLSAVKVLERLLKRGDEKVEFNLEHQQAVFRGGDWLFATRLIAGVYPDWRQLIAALRPSITLLLEREPLAQAIERLLVLANPPTLLLEIEQGQMRLHTHEASLCQGEETVSVEGGPTETVKIAFNGGYLLQGLRLLQGSHVRLELENPTKPAIWRSLSENHFYLVMPILLRSGL